MGYKSVTQFLVWVPEIRARKIIISSSVQFDERRRYDPRLYQQLERVPGPVTRGIRMERVLEDLDFQQDSNEGPELFAQTADPINQRPRDTAVSDDPTGVVGIQDPDPMDLDQTDQSEEISQTQVSSAGPAVAKGSGLPDPDLTPPSTPSQGSMMEAEATVEQIATPPQLGGGSYHPADMNSNDPSDDDPVGPEDASKMSNEAANLAGSPDSGGSTRPRLGLTEDHRDQGSEADEVSADQQLLNEAAAA